MNRYIVVLHKLFALEETIKGAIDYLYQQTVEGRFQDTTRIFTDIVMALQEINNSLAPILPKLENNQLTETMLQLFNSLEMLSHIYRGHSQEEELAAVENVLLPAYKQWQLVLKNNLLKFTLS